MLNLVSQIAGYSPLHTNPIKNKQLKSYLDDYYSYIGVSKLAFLKNLSRNNSISLYKFSGDSFRTTTNDSLIDDEKYVKVSFIDFETTGLDFEKDEVIEIGLRTIAVNKHDYQDFYSLKDYESYNDTNNLIDEEVTMLTGITKDMILDKKIDWTEVESILKISDVVVAHNATFDRWFLEKHVDIKNIWACSKADINWKSRGFLNTKLELLSIWHGFYYDSIGVMNDVMQRFIFCYTHHMITILL